MTTEGAPRRAPRLGLTALEWKLAIAAVLGASYSAVWLAIAGGEGAPAAPAASARRTKAEGVVARAPKPTGAARIRTRSS